MATRPCRCSAYAADGGTFGTYHQDGSVGGYWKRLDYFSDYSGYGTQNSTPDSQFHRDAYLGNLGYPDHRRLQPCAAPCERVVAGYNSANAIAAYGIPDDAANNQWNTIFGVTLDNHANDRWHNLVRYGGVRLRSQYNDYAPTGIPFDPYGLGFPSYYLGAPVTQRALTAFSITPGADRAGRALSAAAWSGHLSVRRNLSAGIVVPDQYQLRLCANRLPRQRKADRAVRFSLHQRNRLHLQPVHRDLDRPTATISAT